MLAKDGTLGAGRRLAAYSNPAIADAPNGVVSPIANNTPYNVDFFTSYSLLSKMPLKPVGNPGLLPCSNISRLNSCA